MTTSDPEHVRALLKDVDLDIWLEDHNPQQELESEEIQMPDPIPDYTLVAIRPDPKLYSEPFWIAQILYQVSANKYRIRYYGCKKGGKWQKLTGKTNEVTIHKATIVYAGVVLNQNQTMSAGSQKHIDRYL
jgi:hypothetical protein